MTWSFTPCLSLLLILNPHSPWAYTLASRRPDGGFAHIDLSMKIKRKIDHGIMTNELTDTRRNGFFNKSA
jgi:hypothetical protein